MIHVENLGFSYNGAPVLQALNFSVSAGEFVGVIGPNGAGKSTLLKILDGILKPLYGKVLIERKPLRKFSRRDLARWIGFVPQSLSTAYDFSAWEVVLMGRFPHQKRFGPDSREDHQLAAQAMQATDCLHLRERGFATLSGGEKQRVILASALAQEPKILLLDEPTTALDLKHQIHFYSILKNLKATRKMTILSVTHDVNLAAQFCQRLIVLKDGRITADGTVQQVLKKEILESIYETAVEVVPHPVSGLPVILPGNRS
ncbi:MAG: heme ABC transporter ATP-binding protein [Calditrichia bacterium]